MRPRAAEKLTTGKSQACTPGATGIREKSSSSHVEALLRRMGAQRRRIVGLARMLGANHADAQDVAQQTLIKAWQNIDEFRGSDCDIELRNWLFAIARNCYYDLCRRSKLRAQRTQEAASTGVYPCSGFHACELADVERALARIVPEQREAFCAQALGAEYQVIARRAGVAIGTIKSRISRAREALSA